jgi:hypothetical protein
MASLIERIKQVFSASPEQAASSGADSIAPVHRKVLMIVHDPLVESESNRRLTEVFNWHKPAKLAEGYISDLKQCSGGYLNYEIVDRIDADWYPPKEDGFRYTDETYLAAWKARKPHKPDRIDYPAQIEAFQLEHRHRMGEFDEVWFFSFPFAGDYESTMAGPGAFWCNSPPVKGTERFRSRFVMMGFNYERGNDVMLENFGHRTESIMKRVFETVGRRRDMWELFIQHEKTHPGQSHCGTVHYAPNSEKDYDWGNTTPVTSFCDDWLTYPDLPRNPRTMTAADWGNGDMRAHHLWWLSHLPKASGESDGVSNNWWQYVVDPNLV